MRRNAGVLLLTLFMAVLAVVLLVAALAVLGIAVYRAIVGRGALREDGDEAPGARVVFDEVVDPARLRSELSRHRAGQHWRPAVIAGFRLAVVSLIDRQIADERPGATTGDFGRAVAARRPDLSSRYEPAAGAFERGFVAHGVPRCSEGKTNRPRGYAVARRRGSVALAPSSLALIGLAKGHGMHVKLAMGSAAPDRS